LVFVAMKVGQVVQSSPQYAMMDMTPRYRLYIPVLYGKRKGGFTLPIAEPYSSPTLLPAFAPVECAGFGLFFEPARPRNGWTSGEGILSHEFLVPFPRYADSVYFVTTRACNDTITA
jgi:hypothetical protein